MIRTLSSTILCLSFLHLSACSSIRAPGTINYETYMSDFDLSKQAKSIIKQDGVISEPITEKDAALIYIGYKSNDTDDMHMSLLVSQMHKSDLLCERYMSGVLSQSRYVTGGFGVLGTVLGAADGLLKPASTQTIVSATATAMDAIPNDLTKTLLGGQEVNLIYKSVINARTRERARIMVLAQENKYLGLAELATYHSTCGLSVGINELNKSVADSGEKAGDEGAENANTEIKSMKNLITR